MRTAQEFPRPFMKWAGGKRQLIPQITRFLPKSYNKYIEPFVGGGAMFFSLSAKRAILMDINPDLINIYQVIKTDLESLITSLKKHKNEEAYYYQVRNVDRNREEFCNWSNVEKASRHIFMNHVCFNGLFRVNSSGYFNVPFGDYKNPTLCDENNLRAVHDSLQNVDLYVSSFEKVLELAEKDDFVYFDPPYVPLSETANFTSYTKENFGPDDQKKLFQVFRQLDAKGCKIIMSNSYCDFILDLYKEYRIETLMASRAINRDATKRGKIKEVLILNNFL